MPNPILHYTLIAFDLHNPAPVLFRSTPHVTALHNILTEALDRGARLISIRAVHPLPEPKRDPK